MKFAVPRIFAAMLWIAITSVIAAADQAGDLVVQFPSTWHVVAAEAESGGVPIAGKISEGKVDISGLDSSDRYNVKLSLDDGRVLQGVDMGWYNADPVDADAGDLDDDDRQQILAILNLPGFFNRCDMLVLRGNHDRAVALIQLVRDRPFAGDTGQGVVWRIELWYMKNEHGGWLKESSRVVKRVRFDNADQFKQATGKLIWCADLGGVIVPAQGTTITAPPLPSTQPATASQ
jgi:hypothetical protein